MLVGWWILKKTLHTCGQISQIKSKGYNHKNYYVVNFTTFFRNECLKKRHTLFKKIYYKRSKFSTEFGLSHYSVF